MLSTYHPKFSSFLYHVVLPLRSAQPYCGACLEGILHDQSLFGHKIHIATFNQNNSSLLMWQPQETGPHTSVGTNWSNCSTMHSSFQLNEHLNSLQLDTCVYGQINTFGNLLQVFRKELNYLYLLLWFFLVENVRYFNSHNYLKFILYFEKIADLS